MAMSIEHIKEGEVCPHCGAVPLYFEEDLEETACPNCGSTFLNIDPPVELDEDED